MSANEFAEFRLAGGTALSLQKGHRESVDIELVTDSKFKLIDFDGIDKFLKKNYPFVSPGDCKEVEMTKSYFVGEGNNDSIKLDIFCIDKFIRQLIEIDKMRLANVEEISAMKLESIARGGSKIDFWDIHELMQLHPLNKMIAFHEERYPNSLTRRKITEQLTEFSSADEEVDPVCLKNKYWEVIKLEMIDFAKK